MTPAEWLTVIAQLITAGAICGFIISQLALQRRLVRADRAKTLALLNALSLIKALRMQMKFDGPADDDPVRQLMEQMEKAIKE